MTVTEINDDVFDFAPANENPELAEAAAKIAAGAGGETPPAPVLSDPSDGPVLLPGGFRRARIKDGVSSFEEVAKAWVRELNGEDEEKISKARLSGEPEDFVRTVLECGVERFEDERPTPDDFAALLIGDREFLLTRIAAATYGDQIEYYKISCPHCNDEFDISLSVTEDIPVKRLDKPEERTFDVKLRKDRVAKVTLPTSSVMREIAGAETNAKANTTLIAQFVSEITGPKGTVSINGDEDAALKLGIADRQTLVDEMYNRMPGPQYNEVRFNHDPGCGEEVRLEVTVADLFRSL